MAYGGGYAGGYADATGASIFFTESDTLSLSGTAFSTLRNSRESIEALEAASAAVRNSRESIEALWNIFVTLLDSRESYEALWQLPTVNISAINARASIEILEGPVLNVESWGLI